MVDNNPTAITRFSTIQTDPLRNFRFRADFSIAGGKAFDSRITKFSGGFQSITGFGIQIAEITYREGGFNTTSHKIPGQAAFNDIQMSRGMLYGNDQAITWMRGLFAVTSGEGLDLGTTSSTNKNYRCNIRVYVMDHPNSDAETNTPRMGFLIRNAWPKAIGFTDLMADQNALMFETITFAHEGLSVFYTDENGKPSDATYQLNGV